MLEITNLIAGYSPQQPILNGLNLRLYKGERLAILGQNGAGKSTIAKAIMGLVPFVEGDIRLNGKSLRNLTQRQLLTAGIGYFMQGGRVFAHLNAFENLQVATNHLPRTTATKQIAHTWQTFTFFENPTRTTLSATYLSGGERHQLAFAMVIAATPNLQLLIADEPSAGVSADQLEKISLLLHDTLNQRQASLILIEQNLTLASQQTNYHKQVINGSLTDQTT